MPLSDQEADRRWENMREAMILAMHKVMMEGEFKDQYYQEYNRLLSQFRQRDADTFLSQYFSDDPGDPTPGEQ